MTIEPEKTPVKSPAELAANLFVLDALNRKVEDTESFATLEKTLLILLLYFHKNDFQKMHDRLDQVVHNISKQLLTYEHATTGKDTA